MSQKKIYIDKGIRNIVLMVVFFMSAILMCNKVQYTTCQVCAGFEKKEIPLKLIKKKGHKLSVHESFKYAIKHALDDCDFNNNLQEASRLIFVDHDCLSHVSTGKCSFIMQQSYENEKGFKEIQYSLYYFDYDKQVEKRGLVTIEFHHKGKIFYDQISTGSNIAAFKKMLTYI